MPDRITRPEQPSPERKHADEDGPSKPSLDRPMPASPLRDRLKRIDPKQAEKYRQRSGE